MAFACCDLLKKKTLVLIDNNNNDIRPFFADVVICLKRRR